MFKESEITIIFKDVFVMPEGAVAMINRIYDENGGLIKEKSEMKSCLNIIIVIGALTTDIRAIENNQSIGTLCFGLKKAFTLHKATKQSAFIV